MECVQDIRIPRDRIGVLVGEKGSVKKKLQNEFDVMISVDSEEGEVLVSGGDGYNVFLCLNVIKAIARGFNPRVALLLKKENYAFEIINISDYCNSKSDLIRIRARVIGKYGRFRKHVEELTGCTMVVYGKTVGLIGELSIVGVVKRAVENLLRGSPHSNVIRFLEEQIKMLRGLSHE
ncbi:RNA-processing protein [Candidatus Woesearchaeota archaeon]|nr:RNA-processing protein [Candidatus Woesearchaeota archaeon]